MPFYPYPPSSRDAANSKDVSVGRPNKGLYDPSFEHDACGVGVVADIKGRKSHNIIEQGLQVLINLGHRGACGSDPDTGDGAGLLVQMPHAFFQAEAAKLAIQLGDPGEWAIGMVFLPQDPQEGLYCQQALERITTEEGQRFLGWRDVPVDPDAIGIGSRRMMPVIRQAIIGRGDDTPEEASFERKLYVIRRRVENEVAASDIGDPCTFYIPSLSANRIVYKGLLMAHQIRGFYLELADETMVSSFAMVHSRFSTNTLGSWRLAHPYRFLQHNGEINTLRGNINWMAAREGMLASEAFGDDLQKLFPIIQPGQSDTACIDNALELLLHTGRSLPHAMLMLIPEACASMVDMPKEKRDFYEYYSCLMEPWDGPALIAFTDGTRVGAILDRNGLRPFRYLVTKDDLLVMASETGVLPVPPEDVLFRSRLQPGRMFLIDPSQGRIVSDEEIKTELSSRHPFGQWLTENRVKLDDLPQPPSVHQPDFSTLATRQRAFGYTQEELQMLIGPMASGGAEAIGSMGNDTPLGVLSDRSPLMFNYFKQLFAQVTNPPLDAIREELVTSLEGHLGSEQNLFEETPQHSRQLKLMRPLLSNYELEQIRNIDRNDIRSKTISTLFRPSEGEGAMVQALERLCAEATGAITSGYQILILSDRGVDAENAPIPSLLATSTVHHHLIHEGSRARVGLVVESGEPREVSHFCLLVGYGAAAVNPYLAFETIADMVKQGTLATPVSAEYAEENFIKAMDKGLLKVMSKMGISAVQSYRGAQIFEAVGLNQEVIDRYFTWTPSRIEGVGLDIIEAEAIKRHQDGYGSARPDLNGTLDPGGYYQWRVNGEYHMYNPQSIAALQKATKTEDYETFQQFTDLIDEQSERLCTLRGLLNFRYADEPMPHGRGGVCL